MDAVILALPASEALAIADRVVGLAVLPLAL